MAKPLIHYIWTNLINKLKIKIYYLSIAGLFVEGKIFLANNKVRDG